MLRMTGCCAYLCSRHFKGGRSELPKLHELPRQVGSLVTQGISVNSSYSSDVRGPEGGGLPQQIGNKTECALLGFVIDLGVDYRQVRREMPDTRFRKVYTFNSARKSMSTIVPLEAGGFRVYTKGASEIIMKKCSFLVGKDGNIEAFTTQMQERLVQTVIEPMAKDGLRTISLAYRDFVPIRQTRTR